MRRLLRLPDLRLLLPRRDAAALRRLPRPRRPSSLGDPALARGRRPATPRPASCGPQIADTAAGGQHGPLPRRWSSAGSSCCSAAAARRTTSCALSREVGRRSPPASTSSESDRLAELDAIAELAARVVPLEQEACAALRRGRRVTRARPPPARCLPIRCRRRPRRVLVAGTSGSGKTTLARVVAGGARPARAWSSTRCTTARRWTKRPEFDDDVAPAGRRRDLGDRVAVRRGAGACCSTGPTCLVWLDLPRARGDAPGRAPDPAPAGAPRGAVERQRRAAAADLPDRSRPHRPLGLAHPRAHGRPGRRGPAPAPRADRRAADQRRRRRRLGARATPGDGSR